MGFLLLNDWGKPWWEFKHQTGFLIDKWWLVDDISGVINLSCPVYIGHYWNDKGCWCKVFNTVHEDRKPISRWLLTTSTRRHCTYLYIMAGKENHIESSKMTFCQVGGIIDNIRIPWHGGNFSSNMWRFFFRDDGLKREALIETRIIIITGKHYIYIIIYIYHYKTHYIIIVFLLLYITINIYIYIIYCWALHTHNHCNNYAWHDHIQK